MNIANSRSLLLCILVCLFASSANAALYTNGETKGTKKEIIIVNIDEDLNSQLSSIADYTYNVYRAAQKSVVTITAYLSDKDAESTEITDLVSLLTELGVEEEHLVIKKDAKEHNLAYFTLSIAAGPDVQ